MELGTFERQLRLMVLLAQNRTYTDEELCRRLDIGRRTIYRYVELFRDMGFIVTKENGCWRIDRSSPFFREITDRVHFSDEEALTLRHILDGVSGSNLQARLLRSKLCRIYDFGLVDVDVATDEALGRRLNTLYESMKERRVVVLRGYRSGNSGTVSDRVVEPFQLLQGGGEVRCYELRSGVCKTFKLARMEEVEMLDIVWSNESRHVSLKRDAFGFCGESTHRVVLRLGALAGDLLREEYPRAYTCLKEGILTIDVCSFLGLGRFVMGLPEEVEVLENEDFRAFLREKAEFLTKKVLCLS